MTTKTMVTRAMLLGLLTVGAGCADRTHIGGPAYGRAYATAFQRQTVDPNAGRAARKITHLDSQDAAVIAKAYRQSMSKDQVQNDQGMVLVSPRAGAGGSYMPSPSVPEGR